MHMTKEELLTVTGGGVSVGLIAGIGAAITFIIGILDGYLRPQRCNE